MRHGIRGTERRTRDGVVDPGWREGEPLAAPLSDQLGGVTSWQRSTLTREEIAELRWTRTEARSALLAIEAARDEEVQTFRRRRLRGRLLRRENVEAWVERQERLEHRRGLPGFWVAVAVEKPSTSTVQGCRAEEPATVRELTYAVPHDRWVRASPTRSGGVLEKLRVLSEQLARRYAWDAAQAATFVLTGAIPIVPMIRLNWDGARGRVVLDVDSFVTPREVALAYGKARHPLVKTRPRPQTEKHLRLAVWFAERPAGESWAQRMAVWNREHRKWRYRRAENFARDAVAALKRLHPPRDRAVEHRRAFDVIARVIQREGR